MASVGLVQSVLRSLFYSFCSIIYNLIIYMYKIFELLCSVRILDLDFVDKLSQRIGLILGLVMLFIVIFSLINTMLNPDLLTDAKKGPVNIIKKVVVVIVMFGFSNFAFNSLYYVQDVVIESNFLGKILIPAQLDNGSQDKFGNVLAKNMFMSFYGMNPEVVEAAKHDSEIQSTIDVCNSNVSILESQILSDGSFELAGVCLDTTVKIKDVNTGDKKEVFVVEFNYLFALLVGCFLVYFIFMYCISVGVRAFQLVFLEIVSPMAIVSYLSPKDDTMLSKWLKIYVATYIDVFIRIVIISFITFLISIILNNDAQYGNVSQILNSVDFWTRTLLKILIIFALLTFAKKAPDLLKDLFPAGASKLGFGVNSPKKLFDNMLGGSAIKKTLSTGTKLATAGSAIGLTNLLLSGVSRYRENRKLGATRGMSFGSAAFGGISAFGRGLFYGGKNGFKDFRKGINEQREIDNKYAELRKQGGTLPGAFQAKAMDFFGDSPAAAANAIVVNANEVAKNLSNSKNAADEIFFVKQAKDTWEQATQWEGESEVDFKARKEGYRKEYKRLQKAAIKYAITGDGSDLTYEEKTVKKVYKKDAAGNTLFDQYEEKVESVSKSYVDLIPGDHDASLALKKIANEHKTAQEFSHNRHVEFVDDAGERHILDLGDDESVKSLLKEVNKNISNPDDQIKDAFALFMKMGDYAANTEFEEIRNGLDVKKAEAEHVGIKLNTGDKK